jgi:hypothetical protein
MSDGLLYYLFSSSDFVSNDMIQNTDLRTLINESQEDERKEDERKEDERKEDDRNSVQSKQYKNIETIKDKGLECPICLNVITGTVAVTTCLHKFCSNCIYKHCDSSINKSCPLCRNNLEFDDIILVSDLTEYLDNSIVYCKNSIDCKVEIQRKDYNTHIISCEYNKKQCVGCKSFFYEKDIYDHMNICDHRLVKCNLCFSFSPFIKQEEHRLNHCHRTMIKCPNTSCNHYTQRHNMLEHSSICDNRIIQCTNGCHDIIEYKDILKHRQICPMRIVTCDDCGFRLSFSELEKHATICPLKIIVCIYCETDVINNKMKHHIRRVCKYNPIKCILGCGINVNRCTRASHKKKCEERIIRCRKCRQPHTYSKSEKHILLDCPNTIVKCSDCNKNVNRYELLNHTINLCLFRSIKCKYMYSGCEESFLPSQEEEHYNKNKDIHMELMEKYIIHSKNTISTCF